MHKLGVVILNWNTFSFTKACLLSLLPELPENSTVYMVDNGSKDDSAMLLANEFPELTHMPLPKNVGFAEGNTIGMKRAIAEGCEHILLLNNDTEVAPNFYAPLQNRLQENTQLAAVQPLIAKFHEPSLTWNAGGTFNRFFGLSKTTGFGAPISTQRNNGLFTQWITGCCMLLSVDAIKKVGFFDSYFFAYFEDVDWAIRFTKAGYQLGYEPTSLIFHHAGASSQTEKKSRGGQQSPMVHYLGLRNHVYLIKKHADFFNPIGVWVYQIVKIKIYSLYFIARGRFTKLRMAWKGWIAGIKKPINTADV